MSWRDGLRPASFRGVPFETRGGGKSAGRRGSHKEYPGRDRGFVQDAGQHDAEIDLDAYVIGEDWISRRDALEAALLQPGSGRLIHPTRGALDVVPVPGRWSVRERSGSQRMAAFRLAFLLADDVPRFPSASASTTDAVRDAGAVARAAAIEAAVAALDVSGPDWIAADAGDTVDTLADEIAGVAPLAAGATESDTAGAAGVGTVSGGVAADAASAEVWLGSVRVGGLTGAALTSGGWRSWIAAIASAGVEVMRAALAVRDMLRLAVQVVATIEAAFHEIASDGRARLRSPGGAYAGALRLVELEAPVQDEDSISGARRAANARALYRLVRIAGLATACEAALARSYDGTGAAVAVMQTLDRAVERAIVEETRRRARGADALVRHLTDLRAATREALLGTVADIAPVIRRDVPVSLPSLTLAWRLTAGIEAEADIVARNRIGHALFCPAGPVEYRGPA